MGTERIPLTIQQWLNSLPAGSASLSSTNSYYQNSPRAHRGFLTRDASFQSDDGSSLCSSVESVLELRKPDPEAVLLELGFGPPHSTNYLTRIPQRFLQPSKVLKHIDVNKFLEKQGELQFADQKISSLPSSPAHSKSTAA